MCRSVGPRRSNSAGALLHSSAVNQDGRSSSLTAPNGPSQQVINRADTSIPVFDMRAARRSACYGRPAGVKIHPSIIPYDMWLSQALVSGCLEKAALSPEAVKYVALHGTGTPLGDPIEVGALSAALQSHNSAQRAQVMAFGSNKVCCCSSLLNQACVRTDAICASCLLDT